MHEMHFETYFNSLIGGLTDSEYELVKQVTTFISQFSESSFGFKSIARPGVLAALNVFNHIRYLYGEDSRPTILEIGPGNGYLGAMLALQGYPYAATDVCQAFYLYQNHFWNFVFRERVVELAEAGNSNGPLISKMYPGAPVHIPWWKFAMLPPGALQDFDVITCNGVLAEMHVDALSFMLHLARSSSSGSKYPTFLFDNWGSDQTGSRRAVMDAFHSTGFGFQHGDGNINVYAQMARLSHPRTIALKALSRRIMRRISRVGPLRSFRLYDHLIAGANPISKAIVLGRRAQVKSVDLRQLEEFYVELLGDAPYLSKDEEFLTFVRHGGN